MENDNETVGLYVTEGAKSIDEVNKSNNEYAMVEVRECGMCIVEVKKNMKENPTMPIVLTNESEYVPFNTFGTINLYALTETMKELYPVMKFGIFPRGVRAYDVVKYVHKSDKKEFDMLCLENLECPIDFVRTFVTHIRKISEKRKIWITDDCAEHWLYNSIVDYVENVFTPHPTEVLE